MRSLLDQTRRPDCLVITDDASTDATPELLQAFAATAPFPVTLIARDTRLGYAANFIDATHHADADLILFCDQDDIWLPDKIAVVVNAAAATDALVYSHDLAIFGTGATALARPIPSYFDHLRGLRRAPDLCIKGCCLAVRRAFIDRFGWPPAETTFSHDAWIALIATALGQRALIDAPLIRHRLHGGNLSGMIITTPDAAPATDPFAAMLDLYLRAYNCDWPPALLRCLEDHGMAIDPARARAARDLLLRHG